MLAPGKPQPPINPLYANLLNQNPVLQPAFQHTALLTSPGLATLPPQALSQKTSPLSAHPGGNLPPLWPPVIPPQPPIHFSPASSYGQTRLSLDQFKPAGLPTSPAILLPSLSPPAKLTPASGVNQTKPDKQGLLNTKDWTLLGLGVLSIVATALFVYKKAPDMPDQEPPAPDSSSAEPEKSPPATVNQPKNNSPEPTVDAIPDRDTPPGEDDAQNLNPAPVEEEDPHTIFQRLMEQLRNRQPDSNNPPDAANTGNNQPRPVRSNLRNEQSTPNTQRHVHFQEEPTPERESSTPPRSHGQHQREPVQPLGEEAVGRRGRQSSHSGRQTSAVLQESALDTTVRKRLQDIRTILENNRRALTGISFTAPNRRSYVANPGPTPPTQICFVFEDSEQFPEPLNQEYGGVSDTIEVYVPSDQVPLKVLQDDTATQLGRWLNLPRLSRNTKLHGQINIKRTIREDDALSRNGTVHDNYQARF